MKEAFSMVLRRLQRGPSAWAALAGLVLLAPAARAQDMFSMFEPSPQQIERRLERAGFEFRSALVRRGDVYVCDVRGQGGDGERLVIDARTGNVVERFRTRGEARRQAQRWDWRDSDAPDFPYARNSWGYPPRPMIDVPHAASHIVSQDDEDDYDAPIRQPTKPKQVARMDMQNSLSGTSAYDQKNSTNLDKAKLKPKVAKKKPIVEPTPEPTTASVTPDAASAPAAVVSTQGGATNIPEATTAAPASVETPAAVPTPAQSSKPAMAEAVPGVTPNSGATIPPTGAAPPPASNAPKPNVAEAVPGASPSAPQPPAPAVAAPKTVEAEAVKPPPTAKPASPEKGTKSKAVNDLPVTPLD